MTHQKVVLVTGTSSGLGRATARLLSEAGFWVFGTSRHPEKPYVDGVEILQLDVRSASSAQACVQAIIERAGRLDILVNNAGYLSPAGTTEEITLAQAKDLFDTNFFGAVRMTNLVLPIMRQQGGGQIINMSSAAGVAAPPFHAYYAASKFALEGFSEALRYEVKHLNIRVSCLEPGFYHTNLHQTAQHRQQPLHPIADYDETRQRAARAMDLYLAEGGHPDEVAQTILSLIRSSSPPLQTPVGFDGLLIWGFKKFLPERIFELMGRILFNLKPVPFLPPHYIARWADFMRPRINPHLPLIKRFSQAMGVVLLLSFARYKVNQLRKLR